IDLTTWEDTARFTAAAALDERKVPEHLFVSGERLDLVQVAQRWEAAHQRQADLVRLGSLDELEQEIARPPENEPHNGRAWIPLMSGRAAFSGLALLGPSHNALYPAIVPETVSAALARGVL